MISEKVENPENSTGCRRDSQRLDAFNSAFGHDICNEMMTVLGHVDVVRNRIMSGSGGVLDNLSEIEAAAKRAADLCRRVCSGALILEKKKEPFARDLGEKSDRSDKALQGIVRGGGRVLLVDDESSVRAVARQMLERIGFDVESAVDGTDALELMEQDPGRFTCVLLDISMPGMSGDDCFWQLRRLRPDLPVLFSSGNSDKILAEPLVEAPLTTFIQKPYSMASLRQELQSLLSSSAAG